MKRGLILLLWLTAAVSAYGQWVKTGGPEGGSIGSIATDGDHLLATSTRRELYRHDAAGWTQLNTLAPSRLFAVGTTFYAATDTGVYRSTDQGDSWTEIPIGDGLITISADEGSTFASANNGIHLSEDDGITWAPVQTQPPGHVHTLTYAASLLFAAAIENDGSMKLYRSINAGRDGSKVGRGLPDGDYINSIKVKGPVTIYVGTSSHGIYRSTDAGENFTSYSFGIVPDPYGDFSIFQILTVGTRVVATTPLATYMLSGDEWMPISDWDSPTVTASTTGDGTTLYQGSTGGVERADLVKGTWEHMNEGLRISTVNTMLSDETGVLVGTNGGVFRSIDKGENWVKLSNQGLNGVVRSGSVLVGSVTSYLQSGIVRSSDGGETWQTTTEGIEDQPFDQTMMVVASQNGTLFAGFGSYFATSDPESWNGGGVYRSTDAGLTWQLASTGIPTNGAFHSPVVDLAVDGNTAVAVTVSGIYRSVDNGANWTKTKDIIKPWLFSLSSARFNGGTFYAGIGDTLFTSQGGGNWTPEIIAFPPRTRITDVWFIGETPLVAAVEYVESTMAEKNHLYTRRNGAWKDISNLLPEGPVITSYITVGETVLAGTDANSVWSTPISTIVGEPSGVESPAGRSTHVTVAPNPAQEIATISFTLDRSAKVRLSIVNALGESASTPLEGTVEAGRHRAAIDVSELSEGMWFYRLEADGVVTAGNLIVTR